MLENTVILRIVDRVDVGPCIRHLVSADIAAAEHVLHPFCQEWGGKADEAEEAVAGIVALVAGNGLVLSHQQEARQGCLAHDACEHLHVANKLIVQSEKK